MFVRPTSHSGALGPGCAGPQLAQYTPTPIEHAGPTLQRPLDGGEAFMVDPQMAAGLLAPIKRTSTPYVTGTSVLGITYKDGVMIAADTLGSYGSTKRYKSFERLKKVNDQTVIGAGGELSDFQYLLTLLDELTTDDFVEDDGATLSPQELFSYLSRVLYNRRSKMDPLWNNIVVAGLQDGKPFLGTVTMLGVHYSDEHIATGFGQQLARPLFRERHSPDMSEDEAVKLLHEGLRVCYYRDKQTTNKFQIAKVTKEGTHISDAFALDTQWNYKAFEEPGAGAVGTW